MNAALLVALLENAALLLALLFVLDISSRRPSGLTALGWDVLAGLVLGGVAIAVMAASYKTETGIILDTRSILLSLAGLFLGPVPAFVAGSIALVSRWLQGGAGMVMGLVVIATSVLIGTGWRWWRRGGPIEAIGPKELFGFGLVVHLVMFAAILLLPGEIRWSMMDHLALPIFTLYPVATVVVGLLAVRRLQRERGQSDLAENEARYRSLFENKHVVMLLIDPRDGAIVDANPAAEHFYGWSKSELIRCTVADLNELPGGEVRAILARARTEGGGRFQLTHRLADGSQREVEVVSGPITVRGRPLLFSLVQDVTERRQAQARLHESERLFREMFLANPFPMWVYDLETLGFLAVNDAAVAHYGWSREEFLRLTLRDIRPPEDVPRLLAATARPRRGVEFAGEWRHRLADGRIIDVEITSHDLQFGDKPARLVLAQDISKRRSAERALSESEQRLRLALQATNQGIYDLDVSSGETVVSPEYARILGYDPEEFHESHAAWLERLHPDDLDPVRQAYRDYVAGRRPDYRVEFRLRTKDGGWKWILSLGCLVERDADGRPRRMLGTHTDIHALKEAEQQLADALAQSEAIFESSPIGLIAIDASGRVIRANTSAAAMIGAPVERVVGQNYHQLESWRRHGLWEAAQAALAGGDRVHRETEVTSSCGRTLVLAATFVPFRFRDEQRLLLLMRDITENRRAAEHLNLLDTAIQAMPWGVIITDRHGVIEQANPAVCRMTGYAHAELVGCNPRVLHSGRQPREFFASLWQTILAGEIWSGEITNRRKDGSEYPENMIIAPVKFHGAEISHFIAIKQDITEQRKLEQQFLRTQRLEAIGLLAGGIAHDLNNVLAPIQLSVELMRLRCQSETDRHALDIIESSARRGTGIVRQVLTFARGIDGEHAPLRLRDLIREVVLILEETFPRDIGIRRSVAEDTPAVLGDATQLHQVLLNLAVNARDAMPEGGTLTFHAGAVTLAGPLPAYGGDIPPGRYALLAVRDTGSGMAPEVKELIFEPFFTSKPRGKGTGLGLPTVLGILRSHRGYIDVLTEPGAGSEFRAYLPALDCAEADPPDETTPSSLRGADRLVLVCDDEPLVREVASIVLRQTGFRVVEAANGREALRHFHAQPQAFDAVLMDIMMPLMTGDRAVAEILAERPQLPVLIMSGLMDQDAVATALRNAGEPRVALLRKPFTTQELLGAMERVLAPVPLPS